MIDPNTIYSLRAAEKASGISIYFLQRAISSGELCCVKPGARTKLIKGSDLRDWLASKGGNV